MTILFLCTGNTCRSPMAAALFAALCNRQNQTDFVIKSAGISAFPGTPAAEHAITAAAELGADCRAHRSIPATPALLAQADHIICLSAAHARQAAQHVPAEKLSILAGGIPDPYGGSLGDYRACAARIHAALPALLPVLRSPARIFPAAQQHLPALAALELEAFTPPASEARLSEKLALPHNHTLVALLGDEVAGFIGADEIAGEAFIDDLAVFSVHRRRGIAAALLSAAETGAILRGCEMLHIEARESNAAALTLYAARGYKVVGRRKNYYQAPSEDAILMTLNVD